MFAWVCVGEIVVHAHEFVRLGLTPRFLAVSLYVMFYLFVQEYCGRGQAGCCGLS